MEGQDQVRCAISQRPQRHWRSERRLSPWTGQRGWNADPPLLYRPLSRTRDSSTHTHTHTRTHRAKMAAGFALFFGAPFFPPFNRRPPLAVLLDCIDYIRLWIGVFSATEGRPFSLLFNGLAAAARPFCRRRFDFDPPPIGWGQRKTR